MTGDHALTEQLSFQINFALEELVVNIINYGYRDDQKRDIHIKLWMEQECWVIAITDVAVPFNPMDVPEPDFDVTWEERKIGGLGVYLVRKLFDRLHYQRRGEQNVLRLEKSLPTTVSGG